MRSQVRFAMHPDDEREFERILVADESIRLIAGPRWKTETSDTSRSLTNIDDWYCIVWSTSDIRQLKADYIEPCNDWYCRSEYATIQFLRSQMHDSFITEGRIAVSTTPTDDFPASSVKNVDARYKMLRKLIRNAQDGVRAPLVNRVPRPPLMTNGALTPFLCD